MGHYVRRISRATFSARPRVGVKISRHNEMPARPNFDYFMLCFSPVAYRGHASLAQTPVSIDDEAGAERYRRDVIAIPPQHIAGRYTGVTHKPARNMRIFTLLRARDKRRAMEQPRASASFPRELATSRKPPTYWSMAPRPSRGQPFGERLIIGCHYYSLI